MQAMSLIDGEGQELEQPEEFNNLKEMLNTLLAVSKNHDRQLEELRQVICSLIFFKKIFYCRIDFLPSPLLLFFRLKRIF